MLLDFHSRGYLPHLKIEGATYFVTFRLEDSLPRTAVGALKESRSELLRTMTGSGGELPEDAPRRLSREYSERVDHLLDRARGESWLRRPEIASLVSGAVRHFEGVRYHLFAWVVMPNHVHAVVHPLAAHGLDAILHSWKSYTAIEANRLLERSGRRFWQRESYDHLIRDTADFRHCCYYVEENPVKAGLCVRPEAWPWGSARISLCSQDGCAT